MGLSITFSPFFLHASAKSTDGSTAMTLSKKLCFSISSQNVPKPAPISKRVLVFTLCFLHNSITCAALGTKILTS